MSDEQWKAIRLGLEGQQALIEYALGERTGIGAHMGLDQQQERVAMLLKEMQRKGLGTGWDDLWRAMRVPCPECGGSGKRHSNEEALGQDWNLDCPICEGEGEVEEPSE